MVNLFIYFYKGAKVLPWRKVSLFNKQCWDHWTFICKKKRENFNPVSYALYKNPNGS